MQPDLSVEDGDYESSVSQEKQDTLTGNTDHPISIKPYYVDEDDFFKACDQKQLLVIDRYLSTGGDVNAYDADGRRPLDEALEWQNEAKTLIEQNNRK
ncbi:hypothetical protein E3U43_017744 [Larimichthys crocea]|nr:hypothetical protein E3U43_017744 [Larimichthys crocea]